MITDFDRMSIYGLIDGRIPGQPYKKQWWMRYWSVDISQPPELYLKQYGDRACNVSARFKKNRFTGAIYVFRENVKTTGNRWNEEGYGWGVWEKL